MIVLLNCLTEFGAPGAFDLDILIMIHSLSEKERETGWRQDATDRGAAQPSGAVFVYVRVFEEDHLKGQLSQAHLRRSRIRDAFKINVIFGPACLKKVYVPILSHRC